MPYTKREALEKSRKLWKYLAETGEGDKWKAYKELRLTKGDSHFCPLCQYTIENDQWGGLTPEGCREVCPVTWPGLYERCSSVGSPFYAWQVIPASAFFYKEEKMAAAKEVLKLIEEAIAGLPREEVTNANG